MDKIYEEAEWNDVNEDSIPEEFDDKWPESFTQALNASEERWETLMEKPTIVIEDWEEQIMVGWGAYRNLTMYDGDNAWSAYPFNNPTNDLEGWLTIIWKMSLEAFEIGREIQVVVDSHYNLFINVGSPGFVDFTSESQVEGMKLPIKCWIHTHPFGNAYFSHTDWKTLDTWEPMMDNAIVLGDNQYWAYDLKRNIVKQVQYGILTSPLKEMRESRKHLKKKMEEE